MTEVNQFSSTVKRADVRATKEKKNNKDGIKKKSSI